MEIDKGVPLPKRFLARGRPKRYQFDKLEAGDSVHVVGSEEYECAKVALQYWKRKTGFKFTCKIDDDGKGGRIWRVE